VRADLCKQSTVLLSLDLAIFPEHVESEIVRDKTCLLLKLCEDLPSFLVVLRALNDLIADLGPLLG
jgi:hypothetical protein